MSPLSLDLLLGWALVAGVVFGYVMPTMKRLGARMAQEGHSPELLARLRSTVLLARVFLGVLFVLWTAWRSRSWWYLPPLNHRQLPPHPS